MLLYEREIIIPAIENNAGLLSYFSEKVLDELNPKDMPVRFVVTRTDNKGYRCELGVLSKAGDYPLPLRNSIFCLKKREFENVTEFNAVLIIPTGIGAEIGGHSGDGGSVARLLAATCDNLITHPNVVNAADVNEKSENSLYVEGSTISRLLMGAVGLQKVRSNRVILIIDKHHENFFNEAAINSASVARVALGLDCPQVIKMNDKVLMRSLYSSSGRAVGRIEHLEYLGEILKEHRSQYDAAALSTLVQIPDHFHKDYFREDMDDMVNPWGGVEAMLTHAISILFDIPSAHSPMMPSMQVYDIEVGVVDPRKSAEALTTTSLHCVLKGLHKSPRIISNPLLSGDSALLTVADVSCLVIPDGCIGLPTLAALEQGIPVIAVKENKNRMQNRLKDLPFAPGKLFVVENYLEAVGVMNALKAGVTTEAVRRPLPKTKVKEIDSKVENQIEKKIEGVKERNIAKD